jgi:hypothetical protein
LDRLSTVDRKFGYCLAAHNDITRGGGAMWIVTAIVNGERRQLMSRVIENEDSPSFEQIRNVASDLPGSGRFVEYLEREFSLTLDGDSSVRGFDAV